MSVPRDDAGHGGAVPRPGTVAALGAESDQVLSRQHLPREIRVAVVDPGVQHGDGDTRAPGGAPGPIGVQGVERPLLFTDRVGACRGGRKQGRGGQQQKRRRDDVAAAR